MKACPPPDGSLLPAQHRAFLARLFETLSHAEFRKSRIDPLLPRLMDEFSGMNPKDEDLLAWCSELSRWVRWYRVPAFHLTYFFQLAAKALNSPYFFVACELYADAQTVFADDLALSSLETGYVTFLRNQDRLGKAADAIAAQMRRKLRQHYDYYHLWSRPFDYIDSNPCACHLYQSLSRSWLASDAMEEPDFDIDSVEHLGALIQQNQGPEFAFQRILAQRLLGLLHDAQRQFDASIERYEKALAEARGCRLDTEIGHLRRLLGWALRMAGRLEESRHHFEQALAYERLGVAFAYTGYWQALSARELGDTIFRSAGSLVNKDGVQPGQTAIHLDDLEKLRPALSAYHDGRMHFSTHLTVQSPFPVARAAKQQLFRSYSTNAILVACMLQSAKDMLAEVEWAGPRQVTEIVTELAAARDMGETALAEFRRDRAIYYKTLGTTPPNFEEYLANLERYNADRRRYVEASLTLDNKLLQAEWCDPIVEKTLALRIPQTIFLLFHLGMESGLMILIDMHSGTAAPFDVPFGEHTLRSIHAKYEEAYKDEATRELGLDDLLTAWEKLLGPVIEPILPFLPGRHLKIFPRLQMNAVPFHALQFGGKRLIQHCATLSYGQTLGLFLENHVSKPSPQIRGLRVIVGEGVPVYELILPKVTQLYGQALRPERPASWAELRPSISAQPALDTVFACHGEYDPDNLDRSLLRLTGEGTAGALQFSEVFSELDLRGCRSVIMGACESGLARAAIGAEFLGLPAAMLSSGVRYVVGALWTVPQLATAVLMLRYLDLLQDETLSACDALCRVQREVMSMTKEQIGALFKDIMGADPNLEIVLEDIAAREEHPFAHPYHWAGLHVVGDA